MKKIIFFVIALFSHLNSMDLVITPFHSLAFDNFEEIIRYSSERTLHAMNCVCKSLSVFTLPLINKYAHYNYLTLLVDAANKNDAEKIKELIKEFHDWGYEDVLDWMPRIIPAVKLSDDSGLEMHLARGNRKWAKQQSEGDQETIAVCRGRYFTYLDSHMNTIIDFYKNSNCIINYYEWEEATSSYYASQIHHALSQAIEENNIFITKLLLIQNKNIGDTAISTRYKNYALHFALENNKVEIAKLLIPVCNINLQNYTERTPLMLAVCKRFIDLITLLLQYKPNILITDKYRSNALEYAPTEFIKNMLLTALQESKNLKSQ